jgi:hypothetical protein
MAILLDGTTGISASGNIAVGGTLAVGGSFAPQSVSTTGNVTGGNLRTAGLISATGNVTGNYILGNGALLTGVVTNPDSITNGTSNVKIATANGNVVVTVNANTAATLYNGGVNVPGAVSVAGNITGNVFSGNASGLVSIPGANVTGTLATATQNNITSVGTLSALSVTGTIAAGNLTVSNDVVGNLIPSANVTYDLGSPTRQWREVYIGPGSLYINNQKVLEDNSGTIVVSADTNQNLALQTTGTGDIELAPQATGIIAVKGATQFDDAYNIGTTNGNALPFSVGIKTDSITAKTANTNLNLSAAGTGYVNVSGDMTVTGNLTVAGNAANLSVTSLSVQDNIINIAAETTGTPTQNAGLQVIRGDETNVQLRWNEVDNVWQFTNDGTNYQNMVGSSAGVLSVTGNVAAGNVNTAGLVNAGSLTTTGLVNAGSLTTSGNAIIGGDLVVNGNTTSINITDLNVEDPIIGLGRGANNAPLTADDGKDRGEQLWYYDAGAERSAFLGWDDSAGKLIAAANVSITNEIVTVNSYGTFVAGAIEGTTVSVTGNVTLGNIVNGGSPGQGNIGSAGSPFNTVHARATSAQYADLAEFYRADAAYAPGTVVVFGGDQEVTQSTESHDSAVAGVISTDPAYIMNAGLASDHPAAVALMGRVPCRVVGDISRGDLVVTSDVAGTAQRMDPAQHRPGVVIGKALESHSGSEPGMIEIVVGRL